MIPEIKIEFIICGSLPPDEITSFIGILPTRTWKFGDLINGTTITRKQNGWCLSSNLVTPSIIVENHLKPLFEILLPKAEVINEICKKYDLEAEMSAAIYVIDEIPDLFLGSETIAVIAKLKAALDLDIILTT